MSSKAKIMSLVRINIFLYGNEWRLNMIQTVLGTNHFETVEHQVFQIVVLVQ